MKINGVYRAEVLEDFIDTIRDKGELLLKVKIDPFDVENGAFTNIHFPYVGYVPPIKKGDKVYVTPINGDSNMFTVLEWVNSDKHEFSSSLLFESGRIDVNKDSVEMSFIDNDYVLEVKKDSYTSNSNTFNIDSKLSGTSIKSVGTINLYNDQLDLASVLSELIETLIGLRTVSTSPLTQVLLPDTIVKLTEVLTKLKLLMGG